jgi:hypothetical protein
VLLPPEDWGFPAAKIFLGSAYDLVDLVVFNVINPVDCFGMDKFYIDEPAPGVAPEPSSIAVWSLLASIGVGGSWYRRRRARRRD